MLSRQVWVAGLVFSFPLLSLITGFGIGLSGFLFLGSAIYCARDSYCVLQRDWVDTRWVILAFLVHFGFALFGFAARREGLESLDAPLRMLLAISAMLMVQIAKPTRRTLWWGVAGGALAAAIFVAWQRWALGMARPGGRVRLKRLVVTNVDEAVQRQFRIHRRR